MTRHPVSIESLRVDRCYSGDLIGVARPSRTAKPMQWPGAPGLWICTGFISSAGERLEATLYQVVPVAEWDEPGPFCDGEDKGNESQTVIRIQRDPVPDSDPDDLAHLYGSTKQDYYLNGNATCRCDPLGFYHGIQVRCGRKLGTMVLQGPPVVVKVERRANPQLALF